MKSPARIRVRTAQHLQQVYQSRAGHDVQRILQHGLGGYDQALEQIKIALCQAAANGWTSASLLIRRSVFGFTQTVRKIVHEASLRLQENGLVQVDLRNLIDDLHQLDDEFDGIDVDLKRKILSVKTEPIELEGVHLGCFRIEFSLNRLKSEPNVRCFEIVALNPNPATTKDSVTHPHVRDNSLCAGEATLSIRHALENGRIADAFILVRSVLTNYNRDSPYVRLDEWGGTNCYNCGSSVHPDDVVNCERCGYHFCDDCILSCTECEARRCQGCLTACKSCENKCCLGCLDGGLCRTCHADQSETTSTETAHEVPEPAAAIA